MVSTVPCTILGTEQLLKKIFVKYITKEINGRQGNERERGRRNHISGTGKKAIMIDNDPFTILLTSDTVPGGIQTDLGQISDYCLP